MLWLWSYYSKVKMKKKRLVLFLKNALDRSQVLCKRCFRLKNYHQLQATNLSDDDFLEILNKIGERIV